MNSFKSSQCLPLDNWSWGWCVALLWSVGSRVGLTGVCLGRRPCSLEIPQLVLSAVGIPRSDLSAGRLVDVCQHIYSIFPDV